MKTLSVAARSRLKPTLLRFLAGGLVLATLSLSACRTNHYSNAILKTQKEPGATYEAPVEATSGLAYGKNAVFIPRDARFAIRLKAINPAWVHRGIGREVDIESGDSNALTTKQAAFLEGADLWVVISARTMDPTDPMEFSSKRVTKATVVKYNMRSFGIIPLDADETDFTLEGGSSYEVDVTVFHVRDVTVKRMAAELYRNSPGLSGLAADAWHLTGSTFKSLVGDPAIKTLSDEYGSDLAVERSLLELGAILEFRGSFAVLRDGNLELPAENQSNTTEHILVDPLKHGYGSSGPTPASFDRPSNYLTALDASLGATPARPDRNTAFITFALDVMKSPVVRQRESLGSVRPDSTRAAAVADARARLEQAQAKVKSTEKELARLRESDVTGEADLTKLAEAARKWQMLRAQSGIAATGSEMKSAPDLSGASGSLDESARDILNKVDELQKRMDEIKRVRQELETAQKARTEAQEHLDTATQGSAPSPAVVRMLNAKTL